MKNLKFEGVITQNHVDELASLSSEEINSYIEENKLLEIIEQFKNPLEIFIKDQCLFFKDDTYILRFKHSYEVTNHEGPALVIFQEDFDYDNTTVYKEIMSQKDACQTITWSGISLPRTIRCNWYIEFSKKSSEVQPTLAEYWFRLHFVSSTGLAARGFDPCITF